MRNDAAGSSSETVRQNLRASQDPRAVRTRARFFEAAAELARQGRPVTVSELSRQVGMSRAAFYTHFTDLSDLALRMQEQQVAEIARVARIERDKDVGAALRSAHRALVDHLATYRDLYRVVFALPESEGVASRIADAMAPAIVEHLRHLGTCPPRTTPEIAAIYLSHAVAGLVVAWLRGDVDLGREELEAALDELLPTWMYR